ncbi:septum site-determining protein Ssd [Actinoplanes sp. NPDC049265]|uniref:septum site-determining protein Ssd n=1 Tax=Actinoplanes sp. NPDC049265 TaxID=3363902 RepID=UPI00371C4BCE
MPASRLPLVVTADPRLLDDLLRLAAAGGTEVEVATDPVAARPRYSAASIVMIGADQLQPCLRAHLPRRRRVVVVGPHGMPPETWTHAQLLGAEHGAALPAAEPWVVDRFAAPRSDEPPGARVLAVIGGCGGAGASILATALAVTGVRCGRRALLVDADPLGGGLDLALGWEHEPGLRWSALAGADGPVDPPALMRALPSQGDLVLLSFTQDDALVQVPAEAMAAALDAARRGRDLVVVDLPRHLDDAAALALDAADQTLLVVPAEVRAAAAARRVRSMVGHHCDDQAAVVRGPAPGGLRPEDVAQAVGLPLAGALDPEPAMCAALERGEPPALNGKGRLAALCRDLIGAA